MAKHKKAKYDRQVEENYAHYRAHLDSDKTVAGTLDASGAKDNQANYYAGSILVAASVPWGETSAECKIKRNDKFNYTITYQSDALDSRLLTRLDAGIGTHFNRIPGIPQHLTSVPLPHYHEYRSDGYEVAYRIQGVDYSDESSTKFGCDQSYAYFCDKLHIKDASGSNPSIRCTPAGVLPLEFETEIDPNNNVDFPE